MYTVWHVDKYKITFKLVINRWTNEILAVTFATQVLLRRSGSELFDTFKNITLLRIYDKFQENLSRTGITDATARYRAATRRLRNTDLETS